LENEEVLYAFLLPSEADIRKNFMESLTYIPASQEEIDKEMEAKAKGEAYERKKLSLSEAMSQESIDMNLYFVDIESRIPSLTDKELETLRMNSVSAINSYYRLKAIMETEANFDALYYENILNRHVTIRKEASDELIRRGL
ncbi:MAG: hypothetical protein KDK45_12995, partial [Leptospiraceae bacterium]|nr:hypothetical protein [Leptospiraceae bacterium]